MKTITWLCPWQRSQPEIRHQWLTWWENVDIYVRDIFITNFHKNKKLCPGNNTHMCLFTANIWQQQYYSFKIIFANKYSFPISQDTLENNTSHSLSINIFYKNGKQVPIKLIYINTEKICLVKLLTMVDIS